MAFGMLGSVYGRLTPLPPKTFFLRKQLALYQERSITPRRATDATRLTLYV